MSQNGTGTAIVSRAESTARNVSALGGDKESFGVAQRVGQALAASTVVPKDYQGNMPNVLVAMEYANRLGASVLAVMQNLDIIHGRPSLRATFLIGTVNASKRFSPLRYRWQGEEGADSWGCRAVATDRESGEECLGPLVTIGTAKAEGWFGKSGSKWKTIPELMLMYRAGAWWTRVYCPELSLGLHTTDEMVDMGPAPEARIESAASALDAPDPEVETIPSEPIEDDDTPRPANAADRSALQELLDKAREAEVTDLELEAIAQDGLAEGSTKAQVSLARQKLQVALAKALAGKEG